MSRPPIATESQEAKSLFMQCLEADDPNARHAILAGVDDGLADRVRGLIAAVERGDVIDHVFQVDGPPDVEATEDSQPGPTGPTDFQVNVGTAETAGSQIGHYKLLEQIGEGGMGTVFMAQQTEPVKRRVAVKIVKPGMDSRQVVARFEAERQALAMMDHPNIARVFDGGTTESGRPYFVMELVKGIPLTEFCRRKNLPIRDRLELFIDLCRGVQHAHQRGIIHRDLKPSNVLVTLHDGRPVIKIIDFGIAKAMNAELTDKTLFTQFAAMVGTPLYMSPEQAELSGLDVDTRCDVYSLGVLLYELLTDSTPFDRETLKQKGLDEIRRMIRETEPPRPSQRVSTVKASEGETIDIEKLREFKKSRSMLAGELDWITMRALEKDRERRYQSPNEFADDVQRYLDGDTVQACPPSFGYRVRKYAHRHRVMLSTASLVLITALVGTAASLQYAVRADAEAVNAREAEVRASQEAERARDFARQRDEAATNLAKQVERVSLAEQEQSAQRAIAEQARYEAEIVAAAANVQRGEDAEALERLLRYAPWPSQHDRRGWEWFYLLSQIRLPESGWIAEQKHGTGMDWHPDGELLITTGRGPPHNIQGRIWNVGDLSDVKTLEGVMGKTRWGPWGRRFASGLPGDTTHTSMRGLGAVFIRDMEKDQNDVLFNSLNSHMVHGLAWNRDGDRIAAALDGGGIEIWRLVENEWKSVLVSERFGPQSITYGWSHADQYFAGLASKDQSLLVLDGQNYEHVKTIALEDVRLHYGQSFAWHPALPLVPYITGNNEIAIIDVEAELILARLSGDGTPPRSCDWSPDGSEFAIARDSGQVEIWSTTTWQIEDEISAHDSLAMDVSWHPDSKRLASIGANGDCFIWKVSPGETELEVKTTTSEWQSFFWLDDNRVLFIDPKDQPQVVSIDGNISASAFQWPSVSKSWALVAPSIAVSVTNSDEASQLHVVDLSGGRKHSFDVDSVELKNLRFAHDPTRERLAIASVNPIFRRDWLAHPRLVKIASGNAEPLSGAKLSRVNDLAFSRDAKFVATAGGGPNHFAAALNLFDAETRSRLFTLQIGNLFYSAHERSVAWHPGTENVVVGSADGVCHIVNTDKRMEHQRVRHHSGAITALAWHPTEDLIASGGADGDVCVWRADSGQVFLRFHRPGAITRLKWSPDGLALAAQDQSGSLKVWDAKRGFEMSESDIITIKRGYNLCREALGVLANAMTYYHDGDLDQSVKILGDFLNQPEIDPELDVEVWEKSPLLKCIPADVYATYHHFQGQRLLDQRRLEESARHYVKSHEFARAEGLVFPKHALNITAMADLRQIGITIPEFASAVEEFRRYFVHRSEVFDNLISDAVGKQTQSRAIRLKTNNLECLVSLFEECEVYPDEVIRLRQQTVSLLEQLIEVESDNAGTFIRIADTYWSLGQKSDAIEWAKKALERAPDNETYASKLQEFETQ